MKVRLRVTMWYVADLFERTYRNTSEKESIPAGCVPTATVATTRCQYLGVCLEGGLPRGDLPREVCIEGVCPSPFLL